MVCGVLLSLEWKVTEVTFPVRHDSYREGLCILIPRASYLQLELQLEQQLQLQLLSIRATIAVHTQ